MGEDVPQKRRVINLYDAIEEYTDYKKNNFAYATYNNIRKRLELLKNHAGNVPLISITEKEITDYKIKRNKQIEKGDLSPMTLRNDLKVFHSFFNYYYKIYDVGI